MATNFQKRPVPPELFVREGIKLKRGARIMFRNFSGRAGDYNPEGSRNFCLIIPKEMEQRLIDEGWNVKYTKVRDEGDIPTPYIQVNVAYGNNGRPPKIVMIVNGDNDGVELDEADINILDWAEIKFLEDPNSDDCEEHCPNCKGRALLDEYGKPLMDIGIEVGPYNYMTPDGRHGVKGYLRKLYITIVPDEIDAEFRDINIKRDLDIKEDSALSALTNDYEEPF